MKKITLLLLVSLFASCQKERHNTDADFEKYKKNFVDIFWKLNLGWVSSAGFHNYDSILVVPNYDNSKKVIVFATANLDSLKAYNIENFSDNNKTDFYMIKNYAESSLFSINTLKSETWNP